MLPGDTVTVFDGGTGAVTGSLVVAGVADLTPWATVTPSWRRRSTSRTRLPWRPSWQPSPATDASRFVGALSEIDAETVVLDITLTDQLRTDLQAAIDEGLVPGVRIAGTPLMAAAASAGVELVTASGTRAGSIPLDGGATSAVHGHGRGRRNPALRHHDRRRDRRPAGGRGGGLRRPGEGRADRHDHLPAAGRRDAARLRRGSRAGRGPGHGPGRLRAGHLRGRAARQERVRRPPARVLAGRPGSSTTTRTTRATSRGALLAFGSGGRGRLGRRRAATPSPGGCRA